MTTTTTSWTSAEEKEVTTKYASKYKHVLQEHYNIHSRDARNIEYWITHMGIIIKEIAMMESGKFSINFNGTFTIQISDWGTIEIYCHLYAIYTALTGDLVKEANRTYSMTAHVFKTNDDTLSLGYKFECENTSREQTMENNKDRLYNTLETIVFMCAGFLVKKNEEFIQFRNEKIGIHRPSKYELIEKDN